jgi:plasmid maintenance system antidote protein VapI
MIDRLIIKDAIKRYGTSVNAVADKMGISRVTLSTHINGNPSTEILLRIAESGMQIWIRLQSYLSNQRKTLYLSRVLTAVTH